jgi:folylpolyglutamate synthase/dihydropteroate synthase
MFGPEAEAILDPRSALERAKALAGPDGNVLVCGSLYLVGEILTYET